MTLIIPLTPEEEARVTAAAREDGIPADECIRRLIAQHLPAVRPRDTTLDLFAQWEAEDATDDPEELAARNRGWEEFRDAMNAGRRAAGARIHYP